MIVKTLGRVPYAATVDAMRAFTESRGAATPDELWLCEHDPVFTQGIAGRAEHVLDAQDIPVVATNRGGQVTYHGPGQVVAYPLVDLQRLGIYVKEYVFRLESAVLKVLDSYGVTGPRRRPVPRPRQDRRARHQGQPPPQLPRRGLQRGDGPATLRADQPVWICRAANGRPR